MRALAPQVASPEAGIAARKAAKPLPRAAAAQCLPARAALPPGRRHATAKRCRVQAAAPHQQASASGATASEDEDDEVALFRPVLADTELEAAPLRLAYDAQRDGWSADAFHAQVDGQGPALVVALTAGGAIIGGYNPLGWEGRGEDKDSEEAFLFFLPEDGGEPVKLPKVGGPGEAVIRDEPGQGVWFGRDALVIPLGPAGKEATTKSKLGAYYARKKSGARHLFAEGVPVKGGSRGTELASLQVWLAATA